MEVDRPGEGTLEERFLGTLYALAEGQAARIVSGEELAAALVFPHSNTSTAAAMPVWGTRPQTE